MSAFWLAARSQGGTPDFNCRGWSKVFSSFEIFDSRVFWVGKFPSIFLGGLILVGIFWGVVQNNLKMRGSARVARPSSSVGWSCLDLWFIMLLLKQNKMFLGVSSVVRMTTRWGKHKFRWYDFFGFCWKALGIFWGFDSPPPFDHPRHLKFRVPPPLGAQSYIKVILKDSLSTTMQRAPKRRFRGPRNPKVLRRHLKAVEICLHPSHLSVEWIEIFLWSYEIYQGTIRAVLI